jgi:hypothetical protein
MLIVQPSHADILAGLRALEDGTVRPGQTFSWNPDWVHGYVARDVASAIFLLAAKKSPRWAEVDLVLTELADAGTIQRVVLRGKRVPIRVPTYRTVGG